MLRALLRNQHLLDLKLNNTLTLLYIKGRVFYVMPRYQLDKDELKCHILKLKLQVDHDEGYPGEKAIAHKYLNKVLDKIDEYRV